eukprot:g47710.t1
MLFWCFLFVLFPFSSPKPILTSRPCTEDVECGLSTDSCMALSCNLAYRRCQLAPASGLTIGSPCKIVASLFHHEAHPRVLHGNCSNMPEHLDQDEEEASEGGEGKEEGEKKKKKQQEGANKKLATLEQEDGYPDLFCDLPEADCLTVSCFPDYHPMQQTSPMCVFKTKHTVGLGSPCRTIVSTAGTLAMQGGVCVGPAADRLTCDWSGAKRADKFC